jgi:hypothetical protein
MAMIVIVATIMIRIRFISSPYQLYVRINLSLYLKVVFIRDLFLLEILPLYHRPLQDILNLSVNTAKFLASPFAQFVPKIPVNVKEVALPLCSCRANSRRKNLIQKTLTKRE